MNCIQKFKKMTQETFKKVLTYVIFDRSEKNETLYTKILTNNVRNYPLPHAITSPPIWQFWTVLESAFMENSRGLELLCKNVQ